MDCRRIKEDCRRCNSRGGGALDSRGAQWAVGGAKLTVGGAVDCKEQLNRPVGPNKWSWGRFFASVNKNEIVYNFRNNFPSQWTWLMIRYKVLVVPSCRFDLCFFSLFFLLATFPLEGFNN